MNRPLLRLPLRHSLPSEDPSSSDPAPRQAKLGRAAGGRPLYCDRRVLDDPRVGVAAGQILGGLLVTAHLLAAAWRPALLLNAPIGAPLLIVSRRVLPPMMPAGERRLDLIGAGLLAAAMLALVLPLTLGRDYAWPAWSWPCFATCPLTASLFVTMPLLFAAGIGHACGFSPLAERLAGAVRDARAAHLSGLILTASLVGQVVGVAAFVGVY